MRYERSFKSCGHPPISGPSRRGRNQTKKQRPVAILKRCTHTKVQKDEWFGFSKVLRKVVSKSTYVWSWSWCTLQGLGA